MLELQLNTRDRLRAAARNRRDQRPIIAQGNVQTTAVTFKEKLALDAHVPDTGPLNVHLAQRKLARHLNRTQLHLVNADREPVQVLNRIHHIAGNQLLNIHLQVVKRAINRE